MTQRGHSRTRSIRPLVRRTCRHVRLRGEALTPSCALEGEVMMSWSDNTPAAPPRSNLQFRTLARLAVAMRRPSRESGSAQDAPAGSAEEMQIRDRERARLLAADEEGATTGLY